MSPTAFPRFPELALELRSRIWEYATALHIQSIQDIADHLPPWFESPWTEKLSSSLPWWNDTTLHVRILDPYNGLKLRFEDDDFETFVDCFPISAVCHEARLCVARFCQPLVSHIRCKYETNLSWSLKPPKFGAQPVVIRNLHCQPDTETLRHFFPRPTTLTINMGRFQSAKHFIEIVFRFFGNRIQHLVLVQVVTRTVHIEHAYWAHSRVKGEDEKIKVILKRFPDGDPTLMYITRDRKFYVSESFWLTGGFLPTYLAPHLLKISEIFKVSLERLPHLQHIDVNLEVQGWEIQKYRIAMNYKRDVGELCIMSSEPIDWPSPPPWPFSASGPASPLLSL